jgi:hypothetical protein
MASLTGISDNASFQNKIIDGVYSGTYLNSVKKPFVRHPTVIFIDYKPSPLLMPLLEGVDADRL